MDELKVDLPELEKITLRRSSRARRVSIKIKADGSVTMIVPEGTPENRLKSVYDSFKPWIAEQLKKLSEMPEASKPHNFEFKVNGEFFFLGKCCKLCKVDKGTSSVIALQGEYLLTPSDVPGTIKVMLEAFYRRHARRIISAKLEEYSQRFGFAMPPININGARSRFGSCNSRKELNFSWHLAMYPMELIELVILHECSHFREMNHSPAFYKVLSEYLPDHRRRSRELDLWSRKLANYPK